MDQQLTPKRPSRAHAHRRARPSVSASPSPRGRTIEPDPVDQTNDDMISQRRVLNSARASKPEESTQLSSSHGFSRAASWRKGNVASAAEAPIWTRRTGPSDPQAAAVSVSADAPLGFIQQMRDFLHRNATWFLVAGFALLLLQDIFGTHGVIAMHRSMKEADAVQKEIQKLNDENQKLQNRVQSLKSDPATIERIAREEMGLARPGEYIFKLQPKPGEPSTPLAQPAAPPSPRTKKR